MKKVSFQFGVAISVVVVAVMIAGLFITKIYREDNSRAMMLPDKVLTLLAHPRPLTSFSLTDDRNRPFDLDSLKGKWTFIFFGFTNCPDVCPTTLATMARASETIAKSSADAKAVQVVFISVDPNRDTVSKLRQYLDYFDSTFIGATGDNTQIRKLAVQLDAAYEVTIVPGLNSYPVLHSPGVFLVDPRARYHAVFTPPHDAVAISRRFKVLRELETEGAT